MRKEFYLTFRRKRYAWKTLKESAANGFVINLEAINPYRWEKLRALSVKLAVAVGSFDYGGCPLDPQAKIKLQKRIQQALFYRPDLIWFDHFRFDGHWEAIKDNQIPNLHKDCRFCNRQNRAIRLLGLAQWVRAQIPQKIPIGYFAVPFTNEEVPALITSLGQDHHLLAKYFDQISPMLYHRMIQKPVSYISDYVRYLASFLRNPILPIVQVIDLPENLIDDLTTSELGQVFREAVKPPSSGIALFYWEAAKEAGKDQFISQFFGNLYTDAP